MIIVAVCIGITSIVLVWVDSVLYVSKYQIKDVVRC